MRRALTLWCTWTFVVAIGALSGCNRPTGDECEEACAKLRTLAKAHYDRTLAGENGLPEDMARRGWAKASGVVDQLVEGCTTSCMELGDRDVALCLGKAEDVPTWKSCLEPKK